MMIEVSLDSISRSISSSPVHANIKSKSTNDLTKHAMYNNQRNNNKNHNCELAKHSSFVYKNNQEASEEMKFHDNMPLENISMKGWVLKKSARLGQWRARYATLNGYNLAFSEQPNIAPHMVIDLRSCFSAKEVTFSLNFSGISHAIEVKTNKTILFQIQGNEELETEWIQKLQIILERVTFAIRFYNAVFVQDEHEIVRLVNHAHPDMHFRMPVVERTALSNATKMGHYSIVKLLLDLHAPVNATDTNGNTALITAAALGNCEILSLLISTGANVNQTCGKLCCTPLLIAVEKCHLEVVKILILAGADVNQCDATGSKPSFISVQNNRLQLLAALIASNRLDVNAYDKRGNTMLYYAIKNANKAAMKMLLEAKADFQHISNNTTALIEIANLPEYEYVTILASRMKKL
eukprot:gene10685-14348_t